MSLHMSVRALAVAGLLVGSVPAWAAMSCPAQDAAQGGDKIDLGTMPLSSNSPDLPQSVLDAIARMRTSGVSNGHIVDALVPAYCRRVASEAGVSDHAQSVQVERFASHLAAFLYRSSTADEEDILVDVPVPSTTFDAMAAAVKQEKTSQDAWVNAAIRSKLAGK